MRNEKKKLKKKLKILKIVLIIIMLLIIALICYKKAPDYLTREIKNKTNLIINNNNVTAKMKGEVYIDNKGIIYLSEDDVKNYFDKYINYNEEAKRLITTSDTKIATM